MPASSVALPTPVASHSSRPSWFSVPANTVDPGSLGDRAAFAGQHALVDARRALAHDAVDRHPLAGAHDQPIADGDVGERHLHRGAAAHERAPSRLQARQSFERRRRAGPGARFQQLAEQHQRDHRGAGLEVHVAMLEAEQRDDGAQAPRHRRAERDQHVHVGAAAAQRMPGADVEAAADPELHRRRQHELQPARQPLGVGARAAQPVAGREHRNHLREQRQGQRGGDPGFAPQLGVRGGLARAIRRAFGSGVAAQDGVIAGALDRGEQLTGLDARRPA